MKTYNVQRGMKSFDQDRRRNTSSYKYYLDARAIVTEVAFESE